MRKKSARGGSTREKKKRRKNKIFHEKETKFLSKMVNEVKNEYTSELYDSNLTPIHKIDDIIEGYLNASFISNDKKFFNNSYKVIQVVSNSITAKDIKKSLKTKKFFENEIN